VCDMIYYYILSIAATVITHRRNKLQPDGVSMLYVPNNNNNNNNSDSIFLLSSSYDIILFMWCIVLLQPSLRFRARTCVWRQNLTLPIYIYLYNIYIFIYMCTILCTRVGTYRGSSTLRPTIVLKYICL
jgi:hypothetical protein